MPDTPTAEDAMEGYVGPARRRLPDTREGMVQSVTIGGMQGYITANRHEDGTLGEVFIHGFGQLGSTNTGWVNSFSIMLSIAIQYGAEMPMLARKFAHVKFEPYGETDDPDIPYCRSIPDYTLRYLARKFGDEDLQHELAEIDARLGA
jgi:ribonucleoside-diphosphate reductase alpha chain